MTKEPNKMELFDAKKTKLEKRSISKYLRNLQKSLTKSTCWRSSAIHKLLRFCGSQKMLEIWCAHINQVARNTACTSKGINHTMSILDRNQRLHLKCTRKRFNLPAHARHVYVVFIQSTRPRKKHAAKTFSAQDNHKDSPKYIRKEGTEKYLE